jgi:hypothetical protein
VNLRFVFGMGGFGALADKFNSSSLSDCWVSGLCPCSDLCTEYNLGKFDLFRPEVTLMYGV